MSERIIQYLDKLMELPGKPQSIRYDNSPDYISAVTPAWIANCGIRIDFIQPGQQQDDYVE